MLNWPLLARPLLQIHSLVIRLYRSVMLFGVRTTTQLLSAQPPGTTKMEVVAGSQLLGTPGASEIAHGIDCTCYYTENFYLKSPVERHFTFEGAELFRAENAELLQSLGTGGGDELLERLQTEAARRRNSVALAFERKTRIAAEYKRLHSELWTLSERWLDPTFISLARRGSSSIIDAAPAGLRELTEGVYVLPVFSREFCTLLCEELEAFAKSGLPAGKPNSMNNAGQRTPASLPPASPSPCSSIQ